MSLSKLHIDGKNNIATVYVRWSVSIMELYGFKILVNRPLTIHDDESKRVSALRKTRAHHLTETSEQREEQLRQ